MKLGRNHFRAKLGNSFVKVVIGNAVVAVSAPVFTVAPVVSGLATAGATLTRTLGAAAGATLSGQWVKNGTPTGITTSTYAATVEGDKVYWAGVATNSGGSDTASSNIVSVTAAADITAPSITTSTLAATGSTTATGTITTTEAGGTVYAYISTNHTSPAASVIKASGTSQAGGSAGVKTFNFTGLDAETLYSIYFVHADAAGNDSTVASAADTTDAVSSGTASINISGVDISAVETGFRDEKSIVSASGPWTALGVRGGALSGRGTAYAVTYTGQNYNTRMWVRTLAVNAAGDSASYAPLEIVTRPNELPSSFVGAADGPYAIDLSWVPPTVPPVSGGYRIEVYNGSAYELLDNVPTGTNSYKHSGLGSATAKQYRLTSYNSNVDGSISAMRNYATASATTAASPYIVEGDFDTGLDERGIANYWSTTGVVTPNYPQAAIWSGTSILVANSARISRTFDPVDNLSVFFGMKCSAEYFPLLDISGSRILMTGGGGIYFGSPSNEYLHFSELTNGLFYYPGEPVCYVWVEYVKAQGATPGSLSILFAPNPVKPTPTSANFASISHASFTAQASSIVLKGPTQFDHVRASSTITIGDYPD